MANDCSKLWLVVIASACFALLSGTADAGDQMSKKQLAAQLAKAIAEARTGATSTIRYEAAQHLAELTHGIDPKKVDDKTIADMMSLLDEPIVRDPVAVSLGNLGPRARIAIPKLQELLPIEECRQVSHSAAGGIRFALERMGETPPPPSNCDAKREQE